MKRLILLMLLFIPISSFSQSFVFCPEIKTEQKQGFEGLDLNVVFKDSRVYEKKLIEKCTKDKIFSAFVSCITNTYPDIKTNVLDENRFDDNPTEGIITVKIELLKYDATAKPGWVSVANTKYILKIFDCRNGINIIKDTIIGEGKKYNGMGFNKSGKDASDISFH